MNPALWAALGAGAAVLLLLAGTAVVVLMRHRRASELARSRDGAHEAALAAALAEIEALRAQVETLSAELGSARPSATAQGGSVSAVPAVSDYVITSAGDPDRRSQVPERAVLSVTLGEPLVKLAAFGYAVRKALSPESRNRIAFEMRREVKRARKERRRAARRARAAPARAEEAA